MSRVLMRCHKLAELFEMIVRCDLRYALLDICALNVS